MCQKFKIVGNTMERRRWQYYGSSSLARLWIQEMIQEVPGSVQHEKRKRARLLHESVTTEEESSGNVVTTASRMPTGGDGETSHPPASSAPPGEGEPLRTEALSSSLGKEISTSTIPTESTETSREVAASRTERSNEPLLPTARPGPSGSRVG